MADPALTSIAYAQYLAHVAELRDTTPWSSLTDAQRANWIGLTRWGLNTAGVSYSVGPSDPPPVTPPGQ